MKILLILAILLMLPVLIHVVTLRRSKLLFPWQQWFNLWIGFRWHRRTRYLYILPLPCWGVKIRFGPPKEDWVIQFHDGTKAIVTEFVNDTTAKVEPISPGQSPQACRSLRRS